MADDVFRVGDKIDHVAEKAARDKGRAKSLRDVLKKSQGTLSTTLDRAGKGAADLTEDVLRSTPKQGFAQAGRSVRKQIPGVSNIMNVMQTGDLAGAIPFLESAEEAGPKRGSLEAKLEAGNMLTPEEYEFLRERDMPEEMKKAQDEARRRAISELAQKE